MWLKAKQKEQVLLLIELLVSVDCVKIEKQDAKSNSSKCVLAKPPELIISLIINILPKYDFVDYFMFYTFLKKVSI